MKRNKEDTVIYLYGLTKASPSRAAKLRGTQGVAELETIRCGEFDCWISRVPRTEFADNLVTNMENLDWLTTMGVAHQRAVSAIAKSGDIIPARLGTIFLNDASLCSNVEERKSSWRTDLKRIQSTEEWGIKVFAVAPENLRTSPRPKTGRAYLQAKSALLPRPGSVDKSEELESFSKALKKLSKSQAAGGKISAGQRHLRFQVSLLLRRGDRKKLEATVKRFSKGWRNIFKIECTGPWPPYSFISPRAE